MIRTEKLNKTYDRHHRNANHVLKDVSFELPETGFVCILGPSGCGKTSLLNAIGGLDRFDNGTLSTADVSVSRYGTRAYEAERNRNFGYIFQNYYLLPEHSVAYNIYLGLHSLKLSHREKLKRIRQALAAVDMSRYIRRKVGELSGGQQQRVAIARALARRPKVIFADEPTGNLDEANTMNICTLLRQISKNSLVIMVTHEERIANFFADRIIKLDSGRIVEDSQSWQRSGIRMGSEKEVYAGDYAEQTFTADSVELRILQEEGAPAAKITVVALKDRILIKLADNRAITCNAPGETPVLKEGKRPTMTLETVDRTDEAYAELTGSAPAPQAAAGHGISFGMMLREAAHLVKGGGAKQISMRIFLILLTVLTVWTACDYLTVSAVDPRGFITTDSHILEIAMKRGGGAGTDYWVGLEDLYYAYTQHIASSGLEAEFMPSPITSVKYSVELMPQLNSVSASVKNFSYVYLDKLNSDQLIDGRMPEKSGEIVVDTWVLEKIIAEDSITKNAMTNVSFFLDQPLYFERCDLYMTIVGVCDSGQPAMYMSREDYVRICTMKHGVMPLSEFKAANPGQFDDVTLSDTECLINTYVMGSSYHNLVGHEYRQDMHFSWNIKAAVGTANQAGIVVSDTQYAQYMQRMCASRFRLYCADKQAMLEFLSQPVPEELKNALIIDIIDEHTDAYNEYMAASRLRVDGRLIVTVTVIALSMVMLYLLCRSQVQERIGMLAVYRLLGIPKRKLAGIFVLEGILSSLQTSLPAAAAVWLVITVLNMFEELATGLILPWQAALAVYGCILAYHLLVALLPLHRLLRLPPAQLAAKYDY